MDDDGWVHDDCIEFNAFRSDRSGTMIHSELRALQSYWETVRAGRKTPMRSDIDPRQMACDARNLFILEDLGHGNIRFRLAGTAIIDAIGLELRGMNARSIMAPSARESFSALIGEVLEDPGTGYARLRGTADEDVIWEISLLPLRSDFGAVDRVIGCLHPLTRKRHQFPSPLRFRIEHMAVDPIIATAEDDTPTIHRIGFSAPKATFEPIEPTPLGPPLPVGPEFARNSRLQAIEGGKKVRSDDDEPSRRRPAFLRLVKTEPEAIT